MSTAPERPPAGRRELALLGLIAVAAMVLRGSAVSVGLMSDDFMQHAMLVGLYPGEGYAPFDLYAFLRGGELMTAHAEQGTIPWWSVPELHGTVLRPVASLLLWLDHRLLPGRVAAWHLHSLLWFGASVVGFGLVLGRLLPRSIALTAVALFACDAGVVLPLAWLANRCVLVCAAFGFLAFWVHLERRASDFRTPPGGWLRGPGLRGPAIEAALMALCLGAGEYGLAIVAYVLAWELLVAPRSGRARALLPTLIPLALYLLAHELLGYGTFGAETYADPLHAPAAYLEAASERVPRLASAGFWSVPAATINVFRFGYLAGLDELLLGAKPSAEHYNATHLRLAWLGILSAVALLLLARRGLAPAERRTLRALLIGAAVGLLPLAVAPAHARLLLIAQLGACSSVAAILVATVRLVREPWPAARLRGALLLPFAGFLAYAHSVGDLRWGYAHSEHVEELEARNLAAFIKGDLLEQELGGRDVVILNAPNQVLGLYGAFMLDTQGWPVPASWRALALGGEFAMVAERRGPRSLELAAVQNAWMHSASELFFRRVDRPLRTGDILEYPSLRVEILAGQVGHPSKIRVDFDRPLELLLFVTSTPEGLKTWSPPAPGKLAVVPLPRLPPLTKLAGNRPR